ncbi:hypothetical protein SDC9_201222 [bioreactor metagenome]|uniref:Uncharacterized protein n=1 Tax=bioreactor metagenome TaxID=1076179 RepID=A0A645IQB6_9ZZZZ
MRGGRFYHRREPLRGLVVYAVMRRGLQCAQLVKLFFLARFHHAYRVQLDITGKITVKRLDVANDGLRAQNGLAILQKGGVGHQMPLGITRRHECFKQLRTLVV